MSIADKLLQVRKSIPYMQKGAKSYGYEYVKGSELLTALREKTDELGLLLIPSIPEQTGSVEHFINKKDKDTFIFRGEMLFTWIDTETGEKLPVPFFCTGMQDDPSKAFGSALTYSERYFLLKFFNIATDTDDPDRWQERHGPKPIDRPQIKALQELVKEVGLSNEQAGSIIKSAGFSSSTRITVDKFDTIMETIKNEGKRNADSKSNCK